MARLKVFRRDTSRNPNIGPERDPLPFPPTPEVLAEKIRNGFDDGIERTTRDEHMYWRKNDSLAYATGIPFPVDQLPDLMGTEEHDVKMRGLPWPPTKGKS